MSNNLYITDDLTFTASAVLLGKIEIKTVSFHPQKPGIKLFGLSPKVAAEQLYLSYISDKLQVSPQLLNSKIASIRHLPAKGIYETEIKE